MSAWIDQEEEHSSQPREALADVDAGRVIDHQAASRTVLQLTAAPITQLANPRIGEREFEPRDVLRIQIGSMMKTVA